MTFLRQYLIALQFFTRVPVSGALAKPAGFHPDLLRASAAHFPGVGWVVGLLACVAFAVLGLALPGSAYAPLVAAVGCTIATMLLTGGFHENGLARTADALGSRAERDRVLENMNAPHLGGPGALVLALTLMAKVSLLALLAEQSPAAVLAALLAAHVVSRFWPLLVVRTLPYAGDAGSSASAPLAGRIDARALAIAAAWCIAPLGVALLAQDTGFVLSALLFSGLALWALRGLFSRRLRGFTGECLGAAQQVCEVAFYLGAAIGLGLG